MNTPGVMTINDILEKAERLPSPPGTIMNIIRTLEDGDATAEQLAKQIEADVGLLTSVLRLVNSSHYAISGGVTSIRQAIVMLGFEAIRNLVCINGISDYFHRNSFGAFNYENFVRHSIGVGCVAKVFAKSVSLNPDTAFVAAMLHDVGQFALAIIAPNEYRVVIEHMKKNDCHVVEAELAVLGVDHTKIGGHMAKHWQLPEAICDAIVGHHQTSDSNTDYGSSMADLTHVAEVFAHALELGSSDQVPLLSDNAMLRLRLSFQKVSKSFGKIEEEYADYAQMMGV